MTSSDSRDPNEKLRVDQGPTDPSAWEIPDLEEELGPAQPHLVQRSSSRPTAGASAAARASVDLGSGSLLDDELFGQNAAAGALELDLAVSPAALPGSTGGVSSMPPASGGTLRSQRPSASGQYPASSRPDQISGSMPPLSSVAPAPSIRTRCIRRAPAGMQPQLTRILRLDGIGRIVAGGVLVVVSVVTSATSCSYLSLSGERFSSGWVAGLLLLIGLGLVAHGWFRGVARS